MRLVAAAVVAAVLGIGLLVLQRWVAETRFAAMVLVAGWFAVVGAVTLAVVWRRPAIRRPALVTYGVIAVAAGAIGYWTGFRDREVHEDVIAGMQLAAGDISGADGHAARGRAAIVRGPDGTRRLTLTDLDADPGVRVVVYLARDEQNADDVIDLGDLKGNVGDQQYRIPDRADLKAYDTLMLWCVPFTVRIATAPLT